MIKTANIDDFFHVAGEVLQTLYSVFPVRHLLLVEDLTGPIRHDMTGLPDRKSKACFESLIWLAEHQLMHFRSIEPRDVGVEGAVLTQQAFVLLNGPVVWDDGQTMSRIDGLVQARRQRAYADVSTIVHDLLAANCQWQASTRSAPLPRGPQLTAVDLDDGARSSH